MATSKKIQFYTIIQIPYGTQTEVMPTHLKEIISYVEGLPQIDRQFNLSTTKFCKLFDTVQPQSNMIGVVFKVAKDGFRGALLDRHTGNERDNPKTLTEGEVKKTHLVIKFKREEVLVCLEHGSGTLSMQQIVNYFKKFAADYHSSVGESLDYRYEFDIIAKNNFLEELDELNRVIEGELTIDKSVLGSDALNYSRRTHEVKDKITLKMTAERGGSIRETMSDAFRAFTGRNSTIYRIKVRGKNEEGNNILINTDIIAKMEFVNVDIIEATGEVQSESIFEQLIAVARHL